MNRLNFKGTKSKAKQGRPESATPPNDPDSPTPLRDMDDAFPPPQGTEQMQLLLAFDNLVNCELSDAPLVAGFTSFIAQKASVESNKEILCQKIPLILDLLDYGINCPPSEILLASPSRDVRFSAASIIEALSVGQFCQDRLVLENAVPLLKKQQRLETDAPTLKLINSALANLSACVRFARIFNNVSADSGNHASETKTIIEKPPKTSKKRNPTKDHPNSDPDNDIRPTRSNTKESKTEASSGSFPLETPSPPKSLSGSRSTLEKKSKTIGSDKRSGQKKKSHSPHRDPKKKMIRHPSGPLESNTSNSFISSESVSNKSNSLSFSSEDTISHYSAFSAISEVENRRSPRSSRRKNRPTKHLPSPPQLPISLMCCWANDNRIILVPSNITVAGLMAAIEFEYHKMPAVLKYKNHSWDETITITKEADLINCLAQDKKLVICLGSSESPTSLHFPKSRGSSPHGHVYLRDVPLSGDFFAEFYKYSWSIQYDDLLFEGTVLGKGYFGEVRLAEWRKQPVAAKILYKKDFRNTTESERFIREVDVLSKLRHPKVILFIGASVNIRNSDMVIVTEFMDGGSLYAHLRERREGLEESLMLSISIDVSLAMNYLHGENCFHRDLNSKNILLDRSYNAKLADFGLSKFLEADDPLSNSMGAVAWMAPEVLINPQNFTPYSDVYSFAVVLWEMATGKGPVPTESKHELSPLQLAKKITEEDYRPPLDGISEELQGHWADLIQACWSSEPKLRPKFSEILDTLYSYDPSFKHSLVPQAPPSPRPASSCIPPRAEVLWPPVCPDNPLSLRQPMPKPIINGNGHPHVNTHPLSKHSGSGSPSTPGRSASPKTPPSRPPLSTSSNERRPKQSSVAGITTPPSNGGAVHAYPTPSHVNNNSHVFSSSSSSQLTVASEEDHYDNEI